MERLQNQKKNSTSCRKREPCALGKQSKVLSDFLCSIRATLDLTDLHLCLQKPQSVFDCSQEKCTRVWTDVRESFEWTSPLILSLRVLSYLYLWRMWWICWTRSTSSLQMMASGMKIRWTIRWRPAPVSPQNRTWNSPLRPHPKVSRLHSKDLWYVMALEFLLVVYRALRFLTVVSFSSSLPKRLLTGPRTISPSCRCCASRSSPWRSVTHPPLVAESVTLFTCFDVLFMVLSWKPFDSVQEFRTFACSGKICTHCMCHKIQLEKGTRKYSVMV